MSEAVAGSTAEAGRTAHAVPTRANTAMLALVVGANLGCGLLVPWLLLPQAPAALLLLLPLTALTVPHWALIHEAIHGHLLPGRRANELAGRLLGVLFGASFAVLRFGHLAHHALNSRPSERAEIYDPATTSRPRALALFYFRLLAGVYLAELASVPLSFLPRRHLAPLVRRVFFEGAADAAGMDQRAERQLLEPRRLAEIRLDSALTLAWFALAFWLYGSAGLASFLALALLGRAFLVSFLDNAPHYGGSVHDTGQGYDTRAPALLAPLILNTNLHGTHHRHPNLPWTALPQTFRRDAPGYAGAYLAVPWRQLRGPIPYRDGPA